MSERDNGVVEITHSGVWVTPAAEISKVSMHRRIYRTRGKASSYYCVDCGERALDWSQIKGTSGESVYHYETRCRSCHSTYDNKISYIRQGRPARRGGDHPNAKLTDEDVAVIKYRLMTGDGATRISRDYSVSLATIKFIRRGRTWKHIPWPEVPQKEAG